MVDEIECARCSGNGWTPERNTFLGGGIYQINCPDCNGTGWRAPTPDELDNAAEDAYSRQFEGEPPMSMAERDEMLAKRDAQWGVR